MYNSQSAFLSFNGSTTFTLTGPAPGLYTKLLALPKFKASASDASLKSIAFPPLPVPSILLIITPEP